MEETSANNITLAFLWEVLKKHLLFILIISLTALVIASLYAFIAKDNEYTSSAMIYVESRQNEDSTLTTSDLSVSERLVQNCLTLFMSNSVLDPVIENVGSDVITRGRLKSSITLSSNNSMITVKLTTSDPILSATLVNMYIDSAYSAFVSTVESGRIKVVDYGEDSNVPSGPNRPMIMAVGLLLGLVASYAVAFLIEYFDTTVKPNDDLSSRYSIPLLADVYAFDSKELNYSEYGYGYGKRPGAPSGTKKPPEDIAGRNPSGEKKSPDRRKRLYINETTPLAIVEAYNSVRTNLQFATGPHDKRIVAFTSFTSNEGKSTTATNVSISFANAGYKVLLIDGDMRKSSIHSFFGIKKSEGLSYLLCKFCSFDEAVSHAVLPNLDVLCVGKIPPNPSELLNSTALPEMLDSVADKYDYIFIDTPPVGIIADALIFNKYAAGIVFIVREGQTTHPDITDGLKRIKIAEGNMLGMVKTFSTVKRRRGYYRDRYGNYKYGYSYNYNYSSYYEKNN